MQTPAAGPHPSSPQALIAQARKDLANLATADLRDYARGRNTHFTARYAACGILAERKVDVVWIEYPDQGPDYGAIETVIAYGTCEACETEGQGTSSVDMGIHVCHGCHYASIARGAIRIVPAP